MNPDGHSISIGYTDRVRFYRILLNKFKQYGEFPIKNSVLLQYSHGGQLLAIINGSRLNSVLLIIHTLSLK